MLNPANDFERTDNILLTPFGIINNTYVVDFSLGVLYYNKAMTDQHELLFHYFKYEKLS